MLCALAFRSIIDTIKHIIQPTKQNGSSLHRDVHDWSMLRVVPIIPKKNTDMLITSKRCLSKCYNGSQASGCEKYLNIIMTCKHERKNRIKTYWTSRASLYNILNTDYVHISCQVLNETTRQKIIVQLTSKVGAKTVKFCCKRRQKKMQIMSTSELFSSPTLQTEPWF
jgi:hypothetical protein